MWQEEGGFGLRISSTFSQSPQACHHWVGLLLIVGNILTFSTSPACCSLLLQSLLYFGEFESWTLTFLTFISPKKFVLQPIQTWIDTKHGKIHEMYSINIYMTWAKTYHINSDKSSQSHHHWSCNKWSYILSIEKKTEQQFFRSIHFSNRAK